MQTFWLEIRLNEITCYRTRVLSLFASIPGAAIKAKTRRIKRSLNGDWLANKPAPVGSARRLWKSNKMQMRLRCQLAHQLRLCRSLSTLGLLTSTNVCSIPWIANDTHRFEYHSPRYFVDSHFKVIYIRSDLEYEMCARESFAPSEIDDFTHFCLTDVIVALSRSFNPLTWCNTVTSESRR